MMKCKCYHPFESSQVGSMACSLISAAGPKRFGGTVHGPVTGAAMKEQIERKPAVTE